MNQPTCQPTHSRAACWRRLVVVPLWDFKCAFIDNKLRIFILQPQTCCTDNGNNTVIWRMFLSLALQSFVLKLTVKSNQSLVRTCIFIIFSQPKNAVGFWLMKKRSFSLPASLRSIRMSRSATGTSECAWARGSTSSFWSSTWKTTHRVWQITWKCTTATTTSQALRGGEKNATQHNTLCVTVIRFFDLNLNWFMHSIILKSIQHICSQILRRFFTLWHHQYRWEGFSACCHNKGALFLRLMQMFFSHRKRDDPQVPLRRFGHSGRLSAKV